MSKASENNILLHLTGNETAGDASINKLTELTHKYPAFGVAKFFLAKKLKEEKHPNFNTAAQSAILHFPNSFWFHFKLNETTLIEGAELQLHPQQEPGKEAALEETVIQEHNIEISTETDQESLPEKTGDEPSPANENEGTAEPVVPEILAWENDREEPIGQNIGEENKTEYPLEQLPPEEEVVLDEEIIAQNLREEIKQEQPQEEIPDNEIPADDLFVKEPEEQHQIIQATQIAELPEEDPDEPFEDADDERESAIPPLPADKIAAILKEQLEDFKKPVADGAPLPIEAEPYHTIDYFASQGIRLSLEQQKEDHLAVKVKKFTDWLKQMKRINTQPVDLGIDEATEHKVQDSAASSNELKEVVTETMAEVFAKQGMTEKAIQVYIKLSFLDPSKSAYFASKIEQLKGI